MLKKYGESPDISELRDAGFQRLLGSYEIDEVEDAFMEYLKTHDEVPTPSAILAIIDPATQPLSESVYIRISKKAPCDRDTIEWEYMKRFERNEYRKLS
jgi:hypothetical protein